LIRQRPVRLSTTSAHSSGCDDQRLHGWDMSITQAQARPAGSSRDHHIGGGVEGHAEGRRRGAALGSQPNLPKRTAGPLFDRVERLQGDSRNQARPAYVMAAVRAGDALFFTSDYRVKAQSRDRIRCHQLNCTFGSGSKPQILDATRRPTRDKDLGRNTERQSAIGSRGCANATA